MSSLVTIPLEDASQQKLRLKGDEWTLANTQPPLDREGIDSSVKTVQTVLFLHKGDSSIRGSEVCLIEAVKAMAHEGYRVAVIHDNEMLDEQLAPYAWMVIRFDFPELMFDGSYRRFPLMRYLRGCRDLRDFCKATGVDLIYSSSGLPCQLAVPVGKLSDIPVLCHIHHPAPRRYFYLWMVKWANRLIVPSEHKKELLKVKAGADSSVIYNGVDAENRFRPLAARDPFFRSRLGIASDSVVVGQVGALVPHKRPDYVLEAFETARLRWPQLHLCLVGGGPMEDSLRAEIARRGLEACVTLTGYVDSTLFFYQQVIDIHILASTTEGLGIAAIEASACGLPSLVTDCTGLKEVVIHGDTGYRFAERDGDALVDYIVELAGNPAQRQEMGERARALALRQFSLARYHSEIVAVVAGML